jgi:hypothetical protein
MYNEDGTPMSEVEEIPDEFILDSLYKLDQIFGGAYCSI